LFSKYFVRQASSYFQSFVPLSAASPHPQKRVPGYPLQSGVDKGCSVLKSIFYRYKSKFRYHEFATSIARLKIIYAGLGKMALRKLASTALKEKRHIQQLGNAISSKHVPLRGLI